MKKPRSSDHNKKLKVVFWGTYDTGKPRVRLLLQGFQKQKEKVKFFTCHYNCWKGIEDKSRLSPAKLLFIIIKTFVSYPLLIIRYLLLPPHDVVIIGYWGLIDLFVIWPFARLRKTALVWDFFVPMYTTLTEDRKLFSRYSLPGLFVYLAEWAACRLSTALFCDTKAHAEMVKQLYKLGEKPVGCIPVGAETDVFRPLNSKKDERVFRILFYGQFIPLHGIDTIVNAAALGEKKSSDFEWTIVGKGQDEKKIDTMIAALRLSSVKRIPWVPYDELNRLVNEAHLCLGIFGISRKAASVIPNKVYQICAAGAPLVTGDTPAIREFIVPSAGAILVTPGDPGALLDAVERVKTNYPEALAAAKKNPVVGPETVGMRCLEFLDGILSCGY